MKKIHAGQLILKNIYALAYKNSYKEFHDEQKFLRIDRLIAEIDENR